MLALSVEYSVATFSKLSGKCNAIDKVRIVGNSNLSNYWYYLDIHNRFPLANGVYVSAISLMENSQQIQAKIGYVDEELPEGQSVHAALDLLN